MSARTATDPEASSPARFVVGIDLGTTNSAVGYVDTERPAWQIEDLPIPQVVGPGVVEVRETLPSFHYQAVAGEEARGALRLPWSRVDPTYAVGAWARDVGGQRAGRSIASAKSWLCHSGVDRTAELLPWHAAADVERLSPVEASARYLRHLREAWNARFPHAPLEQQDLVLTLPASFDEVARELTIEAAARAQLPRVVLIEEPQAAFYAWVYRHREDWQQQVTAGQSILICDIGGGTTDFTLLRVKPGRESAEQVEFHRVAVGDHLILGGDNLDLALARCCEERLAPGRRLEPRQWETLIRVCRTVKENLLSDPAPESLTVHVPSGGSRLIGGGLELEVSRPEVRQLLLDGFLPPVPYDATPRGRQSGFQEFGLPFAPDPAITKYLAQFLRTHQETGRPDLVLLNGGFFASPVLRERLLEVLAQWYRTAAEPNWFPTVLDNDRLDLAVARGAAYYGMVRRGQGVRITANAARSYYIGVESDPPAAVCLLPGDAAPGQDVAMPDQTFLLAVSTPVEFPLFVSSTRLTDPPGAMIPVQPEQMRQLPPIRTVLRGQRRNTRESARVQLHAKLSEIGTVELWCRDVQQERSWRLQFDVRAATQTDLTPQETTGERAGILDESQWEAGARLLKDVFGPAGQDKPDGLMKRLGTTWGSGSQDWPPSVLRRIWEALLEWEAGRRRSAAHEARWLNLLGFALRPGYGVAVDDWRVGETWRLVRGKLAFPAGSSRVESFILWRRIAGGLTAGQQRTLVEPFLALLREGDGKGAGRHGSSSQASPELWALVASLELLPLPLKIECGDRLASRVARMGREKPVGLLIWALGRLGQRVPVYGPLNTVVPVDKAEEWLQAVLACDPTERVAAISAMQLARKTDDRYRDLSDSVRAVVLEWLARAAAPDHLRQLVREVGTLEAAEQGAVFGEALPKGLRIA